MRVERSRLTRSNLQSASLRSGSVKSGIRTTLLKPGPSTDFSELN
jgi:hypothetical protein